MKAIAAALLLATAVFAQQPQPPKDPAEAAQTPPSKTTPAASPVLDIRP